VQTVTPNLETTVGAMADYHDYDAEAWRAAYRAQQRKEARTKDFKRLLLHLEEYPEHVTVLRSALGLDSIAPNVVE
jgi:predicted component of type VI protein secretion system